MGKGNENASGLLQWLHRPGVRTHAACMPGRAIAVTFGEMEMPRRRPIDGLAADIRIKNAFQATGKIKQRGRSIQVGNKAGCDSGV